MENFIQVKNYTEDLDAQKDGVVVPVDGLGSVRMRRGGLAQWNLAVRQATEEVLGMECNHNYISPQDDESILAKATASYLIAELIDCVDMCGNPIPNTLNNISGVFENPENFALVQAVIQASQRGELFLKQVLALEIEQLKK